jgi:hypothetical protein
MKINYKNAILVLFTLLLTVFAAYGMDVERVLAKANGNQAIGRLQLIEFIWGGLSAEKWKEPEISIVIQDFDNFRKGLDKDIFQRTLTKVTEFKERTQAFEELRYNYIKAASTFYMAFDSNIKAAASSPILGGAENLVHRLSALRHLPSHAPYFKAFQKYSNQFLSIWELCTGKSLKEPFEVIDSPNENRYKVGLWKEEDGYVPFNFLTQKECASVALLYGSQVTPQRNFTFRWGKLIKESGIVVSPENTSLKFMIQQGENAEIPYTADRITCRVSYNTQSLFMDSLKEQFGALLFKESNFIALPSTSEEESLLELLFIEDLINSHAPEQQPSLQHFLTWVDEEANALPEQAKETAGLEALKKRAAQLEEQLLKTYEETLSKPAQHPDVQATTTESSIDQKTKKKKKEKKNGGKSGKPSHRTKGAPTKKKTLSEQSSTVNKKQNPRELFEAVKKEGRVKFREILGIMNKIRDKAGENEFSQIASVSATGSHIHFHMDEGPGVTLVKKHGKQDNSYDAGTVNYFSRKLINALFAAHLK